MKTLTFHWLCNATVCLVAALTSTLSVQAQPEPAGPKPSSYVEGELLVKFKGGPRGEAARRARKALKHTVKRDFEHVGWQHIQLPPGVTVEEALMSYQKHADVLAVEPNYVRQAIDPLPRPGFPYLIERSSQAGPGIPNDPWFNTQYGLAKIGASNAWAITTGSTNVVVAVMDTGINYNHEDLQANMWRNPGEIPGNGIDDDRNGYVDDVHGIDVASHDSDPLDDSTIGFFHGTACAGVIGAVGNNGLGIAGVNWSVQLMAVRAITTNGMMTTAGNTEALNYMLGMKNRGLNLRAINMSFYGGYSQSDRDAIAALGNAGVIAACVAGNESQDNDLTPSYPGCYNAPNVISVAASDRNDSLASFSNWGRTNVDLAAPGVEMPLVFGPGNTYFSASGTSFSAPHVAGAVALLAATYPSATASQLKSSLLETVDVLPVFRDRMVSNGRLNLGRAMLSLATNGPPIVLFPLESQAVGVGSSVTWTVKAAGAAPLSYQWQLNGANLDGETGATLTLTNVGWSQAGSYRVLLSNAEGATNANAGLSVGTAATFALTNQWSYNQSGINLGAAWREPGYNDSGWAKGPGVLAVENNPAITRLVRTSLSLSGGSGTRVITYYFRTHFQFVGDPASAVLVATNLLDDGAIVYLNGAELYRVNMPEAEASSATLACRDLAGMQEGVFVVTNVSATGLVSGDNVLAVEVHQSSTNSPDIVFGLGFRVLEGLAGPAAIFQHPAGQQVMAGANLTLRVLARGSPPLSYQWQQNGMDLPGETNAALDLLDVQPAQSGLYRVLVSNAFGTVGSAEASVQVQSGPVVEWGSNGAGEGNLPGGLTQVVAMDGGYWHGMALNADGTVVAWGGNFSGQASVPPDLSNVVAVSSYYAHSLALEEDGTVVAWGYNLYGQTNVPPGLSNVVAISAGVFHNVILKGDGTVVAFGNNFWRQTDVPPGLSNVVAISAGASHGLALKGDGTVVAWGDNWTGQTNVPPRLSNVVAIAAGGTHSLALKVDGTVVAWGTNDSGQVNVPPGLSNVVAISAGNTHSLALQADGTVVAWGTYDTEQPLIVPAGLTNVVDIASGADHCLARVGEGRLLAPAALNAIGLIWLTSQNAPWFAQATNAHDDLALCSGRISDGEQSSVSTKVIGPGLLTWWWKVSSEPGQDELRALVDRVPQSSLSGEVGWQFETMALPPGLHKLEWVYAKNDSGSAGQDAAWLDQVRYIPGAVKPLIITPPFNQSARFSSNVSFTVTAYSLLPMTYQWQFNGTDIDGATNATLTLTNVQLADEGVYTVVVTTASGCVVSGPARLTVLFLPSITLLATNYTVVQGGTVILSVECTGTLPMSYRWQRIMWAAANLKLETLNAHQSFLLLSNVQPHMGGSSNRYTVVLTNAAFVNPGVHSSNIYLTVLADTDGDGMDDAWEAKYPTATEPDGDADSDGLTNKEEYQSGTDPTDAESYLKVERIAVSGEARIEFLASANLTYTVEYTESLENIVWHKLTDVVAGPESRTVVLTDPAGMPQRYYRLVTPRQAPVN